jgi:hypothetical protein
MTLTKLSSELEEQFSEELQTFRKFFFEQEESNRLEDSGKE